ncbi:beta-ketoacyl-[acyl-carrier-protein] synthase family protein [Propionibacteriaceae bacterium Y1685]|uniref:beta-ketoacyl-[acyl-carrier-protein] synthase family protein n=1 Tax=Microlunatus sp. Y1700 TaxID=3418487 RepID=UPI003B7C1159
MSSTTVVITGVGGITPLGEDVDSTWRAMLAGTSGVTRIDQPWVDDLELPAKIAASVKVDPASLLDRVQARRMDRNTQLATVACLEAWTDAGYGFGEDNPIDPERLGVCIATGIGGLGTLINSWDTLTDKGVRRVSPLSIPMLMANSAAGSIGLRLKAKAGAHTPVSACASANEGIALGLDMLRLGRADVAVVGGTEGVIHPLPVAAFGQMQALSRRNDEPERASRPWDVDRDGFVLGEGSVLFVIETLEHAQARGAKIYGELAGAGISNDAHDMVQPDPSGTSQAAAMTKALREADLTPTDIAHINAHATSTPAGDTTEAKSIRIALGDATDNCVVTGTKSMTGHLLGGAGAIESLATVLALRDRQVPPTINLDNPEEGLGIDIATSVRELPSGDLAAINNSFGFGGANVAVAFTNRYATS